MTTFLDVLDDGTTRRPIASTEVTDLLLHARFFFALPLQKEQRISTFPARRKQAKASERSRPKQAICAREPQSTPAAIATR